jgi:hypothetical protein
MPTKRRRITRTLADRITPAAVAAYVRGDYHELHAELRLKPWECSPLPIALEALGVHQGKKPDWPMHGWERAAELQEAIEAKLTPAQRRALGAAIKAAEAAEDHEHEAH